MELHTTTHQGLMYTSGSGLSAWELVCNHYLPLANFISLTSPHHTISHAQLQPPRPMRWLSKYSGRLQWRKEKTNCFQLSSDLYPYTHHSKHTHPHIYTPWNGLNYNHKTLGCIRRDLVTRWLIIYLPASTTVNPSNSISHQVKKMTFSLRAPSNGQNSNQYLIMGIGDLINKA